MYIAGEAGHMSKPEKRISRTEWEQENLEIIARLKREGRLPTFTQVMEVVGPPADLLPDEQPKVPSRKRTKR